MQICPKCSLPKEICVCEKIAKEQQKIVVETRPRVFGKVMTVIQGIDSKSVDIKKLLKELKRELACGGTFKNNEIELQGDHRDKVVEILVRNGFPREMIEKK
ncbi:MAG: translation initiation factor [Candidatus Aenigmatarchaeota archaeon]